MRHLTLSLTVFLALSTAAQWSVDPGSPLVICDAPSNQQSLRVLRDGSGGRYILWTDDRLGANDIAVYGQRIDAMGVAQWDVDGRLIQHVAGRCINYLAATVLDDGDLLLATITGNTPNTTDTLYAMAYDDQGAEVWDAPRVLAYPGNLPGGGISTGVYDPRVITTPGAALVAWQTNPMGAADYITMTRLRNDGTPTLPLQGVFVGGLNNPFTSGPWGMRTDLSHGALLERRQGNGMGAPLLALRVDSTGSALWPNALTVSANSSGLGYEWHSALEPTGRTVSVWGNGYDLRMAHYDTTGVLLNPNNAIDVVVQADVQENPFVLHADGKTFVTWADTRSTFGGQRQVFMQRFDAAGQPELAVNGIPAWLTNHGWNGVPRMLPSDPGSLIHVMVTTGTTSGTTYGFRAMRTDHDANAQWADTVRFCDAALNPDFATGWSVSSDDDGGAVAVWLHPGGNTIYAARLDRNGRLGDVTGVDEVPEPALVMAYPNPAQDAITFDLPASARILAVELFDARGRRIGIAHTQRTLDIRALNPGLYTARLLTSEGVRTSRFIKQ